MVLQEFAVLTAYFDASYNQPSPTRPDPPLLHTVGGYIGLDDDWRKFRKEWRIELGKKGLADFHMNKYERARSDVIQGRALEKSNPYHGWDREDFKTFLQKIHNTLRRKNAAGLARLEGVGCSINKADFDSMLPNELSVDEGCKTPYMLNVATNMGHVASWAIHYGYNDEIHYVFASGDREEGNIKDFFASIWKNDKAIRFFRVSKARARSGYEIRSAKDEPALQAADIAAYEFNKIALNCIENADDLDPNTLRKSVLNLCREPNNNFPLLIEGDRMRRAFEAMTAFKRVHGGTFGQIQRKKNRSKTESVLNRPHL